VKVVALRKGLSSGEVVPVMEVVGLAIELLKAGEGDARGAIGLSLTRWHRFLFLEGVMSGGVAGAKMMTGCEVTE